MRRAEIKTSPILVLANGLNRLAKDAAGAALYEHNVEHTGVADRNPISAEARDPVTHAVLGGLWGRTEFGLLFLEMFHLPRSLRGRSIGSQLLTLVEVEAIHRGCRYAVVETSTFQAPNFYVRHGYSEFGRVPFCISDHARVFLRKTLAGSAPQGASLKG